MIIKSSKHDFVIRLGKDDSIIVERYVCSIYVRVSQIERVKLVYETKEEADADYEHLMEQVSKLEGKENG